MIVFLWFVCAVRLASAQEVYLWSKLRNYEDVMRSLRQEIDFNSAIDELFRNFAKVNTYVSNNDAADVCRKIYNAQSDETDFRVVQKVSSTDHIFEVMRGDLEYYDLIEHAHPDITNTSKFSVFLIENDDDINFSTDSTVLNICVSEKKRVKNVGTREEPPKTRGLIDDGTFFNINDCVYFYVTHVSFVYQNILYELPIDKNVLDSTASTCAQTYSKIVFNFKRIKTLTAVTLSLNFKSAQNQWHCDEYALSINSETFSGSCADIRTLMKMSYSCDDVSLRATKNDVVLRLRHFQIQPFVSKSDGERFGTADSCAVFATIPILMGVVVAIIVVLVTFCSIACVVEIAPMSSAQPQHVYFGNTVK